MRKGQRGVCVIYVHCAYAAWATIKCAHTLTANWWINKCKACSICATPMKRGVALRSARERSRKHCCWLQFTCWALRLFLLLLLPLFRDSTCHVSLAGSVVKIACIFNFYDCCGALSNGHKYTPQKINTNSSHLFILFLAALATFDMCEWHTRWSMSSPQFCGCAQSLYAHVEKRSKRRGGGSRELPLSALCNLELFFMLCV